MTEQQLSALIGSAYDVRRVLEVLVATGEVRPVVLTYGFVATKPSAAVTPEVRAAKAAARAEAERMAALSVARASLPEHEPQWPQRPKPKPDPVMAPAPWEPQPPKPPDPRSPEWWDEIIDGQSRREAWAARTRDQRARQAEARGARREELRAGAQEHAETVVLGSQAETPHR